VSKFTDQRFLRSDQYRDASKLNARERLHSRFSINPYGWHRWAFDQLALPAECDILELGCGPAYLWCENGDRIPEGWGITLSDFSPGILQRAHQNLRSARRSFNLVTIDAEDVACRSELFDAVIANHMLYHVPDLRRLDDHRLWLFTGESQEA